MTTRLLLEVLRRRWYVVLAGAILTLAAVSFMGSRPPVYWTQTDVVFLLPKSARYPNSIEETSSSVIAMAGLVATDVNGGRRVPATASAGATIAGEGVRDGYAIRMPNSGGQWATNFERPVLDVQVIGSDPSLVTSKLRELVERIEDDLRDRQRSDGVQPPVMITASSAPSSAQVFEYGGQPRRASVVTLLLGVWATVLAAIGVDALLRRFRRDRLSS